MSSPRIIAGKARGFRLQSVPGDTTRPVTDRVKEALFNIIGGDIFAAKFLDLFGGTGSVGIEALSRGAEYVRFNDLNQQAFLTIKNNLQHTGFESQADVSRQDSFNLLKQTADRSFDYIYIAPPQYKELWKQVMQILDDKPCWSADDGWIIVQIDPNEYTRLQLNHFSEFDQRRYGSTLLIFYSHSSENTILSSSPS